MNTTLSVIIPVYNVAPYLEACVASIVNQGVEGIEIILINDGSTDDSCSVCTALAERHGCIRLINQSNQGQSAARNRGLEIARGAFIAFVDSDDDLLPNTFAPALATLESHPECVAVQFPALFDYNSSSVRLHRTTHQPITNRTQLLRAWLEHGDITWVVWDKIYRRSAVVGYPFAEGMVYEDNLYIAHLLSRIEGMCFCTEGGYRYWQRSGSTTQSPLTPFKKVSHTKVFSGFCDTLRPYPSLRHLYAFALGNVAHYYVESWYQKDLRSVIPPLALPTLKQMTLFDIFVCPVIGRRRERLKMLLVYMRLLLR